uniref:Uncharacterized protein n=1 Tax=Oryza sativa subsp. japonica TaxID=39947 RepID=Q2QPP8_ORYSJ|nr:hypothetical protein LOC_Os12g33730 [Oryza sativa Japonica Group]
MSAAKTYGILEFVRNKSRVRQGHIMYLRIKSTGTLTNLKARFWTYTEVNQIIQASVCFSHQHGAVEAGGGAGAVEDWRAEAALAPARWRAEAAPARWTAEVEAARWMAEAEGEGGVTEPSSTRWGWEAALWRT